MIRARSFWTAVTVCGLTACGTRREAPPEDTARGAAVTDSVSAAYAVTKRVPLPGDGSWDHLVAASDARRLYVSHETHVDVLDLDADTLVGVLRDTPDVHGVALAPALGRGYSSNGGDSTLSVFDLRTLAVSHRIHLRANAPDGIAYDSASHHLFAMHAEAPSLTVVDAGPDTVLATVELGGSPDGAVPDGHGHLLVALKDRSELVELDTRRLTVGRRWVLAPCAGPDATTRDAARDGSRDRLLIGCDNGVAIAWDLAAGRVADAFPIGAGVDGIAVATDGTAFVATGVGRVTVARLGAAGRYHVVAEVPTQRGSRSMAYDPTRGRLFVPAAVRLSDARTDPTGRVGQVRPKSFELLVLGRPTPSSG